MLPVFLIVMIDLIGFGIIIPLLPFYAEHFQAEPDTVALVMATYSGAQFIAAPFWGRISDRIGRRPVLMASMAGAALCYVWLAYADTLLMLFAARAVGGFMAGNIAAAFAYMADITSTENRAKGMGLVGAAFGLGFTLGPAIGGSLAGPDVATADYTSPALAAAALSALAFVLTLTALKESLSPEIRASNSALPRKGRLRQFGDALERPHVGLLMALSFLAVFVFAGMEATFAMWSERQFGWGPQQNGYLFGFVGVIGALIQGGLVGRLAKRFGEATLVTTGAGLLAIGLGALPFAGTVPVLLVTMVVMVAGFSIVSPSLNSLISLQVGASEQGGIMGVTRSVTTLSRVVGPAWAGFLFAQFGRDWPYAAGAAVMVVVVVLALWFQRRKAAETEKAEEAV
jgi:DHA1 family tetracycline resistance protein-like MFS transporter